MFLVRVAHGHMLCKRWKVEGKQSHNVWMHKGLVQEALLELMHISSYLGAQKELAPFVLALNIHLTEQSKQLKEDPGGGGATAGLDAGLSWGDEHPGKSLRGVRLQEKNSLTEAEEMDLSRCWE